MIKALFILLVSGFLLVAAQPYNPKITLSTSVYNEVTAGNEFKVIVHIDKGDLTEYSRFSQELPYGLIATNISSPNADFAFENQRVRIIWLKLPENNDVTVEYKIKVHERLKGSFMLGGEFAYIMNDERSFVRIDPPVDIKIDPKPGLDPSLIVDISDFRNTVVPDQEIAETEDFAKAIRQEPELLPNGEILVRLMVRNPEGSTYMKMEENLPKGYMFEEVNSEGGIVSYAANQVRFIWMKQPAKDPLMVTYKLIPKAGETQDPMEIKGSFSYSANGKSETIPFKEVAVNLSALSRDQQLSFMQQGDIQPGGNSGQQSTDVTGSQDVKNTETKTSATDQNATASTTGTNQETGTTTGTGTSEATGTTTDNSRTTGTTGTTSATDTDQNESTTSAASEGLEFRVQVGAFRKQINKNYFRNIGIPLKITEVKEEGFYKYSVGPFKSYDEAEASRNRIIRDNGISGAFVIAYLNGKRITIHEALNK